MVAACAALVAVLVAATTLGNNDRINGDNLDEMLLSAVRSGDHRLSQELVVAGASLGTDTANFLLCEAAYHGRPGLVKLLLGAGADGAAVDASASGGNRTPLHYAIAGYDEANRLDHGTAASGARHLAAVRALLISGALTAVGAFDAQGMTPLHAAMRARWASGVKAIASASSQGQLEDRSRGADPRQANLTALLMAAAGGRRSLMLATTTAIKHHPRVPSGQKRHCAFRAWGLDKWGLEPLPRANRSASRAGLGEALSRWMCELAKALLDRGASVHAADTRGWQPLHFAADFGDVALLRLLLQSGAAPAARTAEGLAAIELAARKGYGAAVDILANAPVRAGEEDQTRAVVTAARAEAALVGTGRAPDAAERCGSSESAIDSEDAAAPLSVEPAARSSASALMRSWLAEPSCDIDVVPMDSITPAAFRERYLRHRSPVLLTNSSELRQWPAAQRWRWDALLQDHGAAEMTVAAIPYASQYGLPHRRETLAAFIASSRHGPPLTIDNSAEPGCILEHRLSQNRASLLDDFSTPAVFAGLRTHPVQWVVGGSGSGAPMHFHQDAFNALAVGTKRWVLRPPSQATLSTEHPLSWLRRNSQQLLAQGTMSCTQSAGDVLYVPDSWSHLVLNLEESVAVAVEFYPDLENVQPLSGSM